ncbi:MAG TPA: PadR family transcriptional regulator [Gemmatimonadales bacterium]|nr:PadR family transcriptional regulator [Gemmatimonadales bacterium]
MTPSLREEIPPGTLDMLVLQTVVRAGEVHGFEIAEAIERASSEVLRVEEGSLYPALQRLLVKGWLVAQWGRTAENRRARYYRITAAGQRQLVHEVESYRRVSQAIASILRPA